MNIELLIRGSGNKIYEPILLDEITWETERRGSPSKLTFTVIKDEIISFPEGARVQLAIDGKGIFYGYIFNKSRNKDQQIQCVAYDQLRYLKNKDTYVYTNKTASEVLKMIAKDFELTLGKVDDTGYRIAKREEDNATLFDIILNAVDITAYNTKKLFVLYDDFGKLSLRDAESLKLNLLIDDETAEDFDYSSSIDDTYTQVKLVHEDEKSKTRKIYLVKANKNIDAWGILQHYEKISDSTNGLLQAKTILDMKNRETRKLTVKGVLGDLNVRAGFSLPVSLALGDRNENRYFMCEKVTHHITADHHSMDITLRDGRMYYG